jgi:hypothetical protein
MCWSFDAQSELVKTFVVIASKTNSARVESKIFVTKVATKPVSKLNKKSEFDVG